MISVAEARELILAHAPRIGAETMPTEACLGRTLAAPVVATRAQPPFHASAMDGYAVRSADTPGRLKVVGESGAGHALKRALAPGECARIFTGAPLPEGADGVAIQEDVTRDGAFIAAPPVSPGKNVRSPGVDFLADTILLERGVSLGAAGLATAAAAGMGALQVVRPPQLAIFGGGDEIVAPGDAVRPDQIFECATFGVAGLAQGWGASSTRGPLLRDDADAIAAIIERACATSDLVVLIGGASVGDHDHARRAVEAIGARLLFEKVSLRPGKPTWFALHAHCPILGLPGNPGSALVTARLFLRPLLTAMLGGDVAASVRTRRARLTGPLRANGPREAYLRARTFVDDEGVLRATPAANQDSSLVSPFTVADALILHPADSIARDTGATIDTLSI